MSNPTPPKSSRLLIDESPLQVLPSLATAIGLNESIILQQVQYWITGSRVHERDGHLWIYNSIPQWKENFPWWSESTIKRALNNLRESGLLIVANFNTAAFDKTLWYRIDYEVLAKIENTKRVNRRSGQNDPTSGSRWTDDQAILNRPIPETTTKITKPETTTAKTHPPVVSPSRARGEPSPAQNGSVGLADDLPALDSFSVSEEEDNSNRDRDIPPIIANGDEQSLSAAPPPPGLTPAQALAYRFLSDPEVSATAHSASLHEAHMKRWLGNATDAEAVKVLQHAAVVWIECKHKVVRGIGVAFNRLERKCEPNDWPPEFLESELYRRLYPLPEQVARERENHKKYAGWPVLGLSENPDYGLPPDTVRLLDALPVPIWEEDPPC